MKITKFRRYYENLIVLAIILIIIILEILYIIKQKGKKKCVFLALMPKIVKNIKINIKIKMKGTVNKNCPFIY